MRLCDSPIIAPFHACSETNYNAFSFDDAIKPNIISPQSGRHHTHQVYKFEAEIRFLPEIYFAIS
jgi:hypothetical protein